MNYIYRKYFKRVVVKNYTIKFNNNIIYYRAILEIYSLIE